MYKQHKYSFWDNVAGTSKDFTDGTFYRFNNKIYTSIDDIFKAYYKTTIDVKWYSEAERHLIQRNSVYQLNIKNVFNVGADVLNGEPININPMYYLNVEVSVNPWVLNAIDVDLK